MRMRVDVALTLSGSTMEGKARAGMFGKFPVTATKRS